MKIEYLPLATDYTAHGPMLYHRIQCWNRPGTTFRKYPYTKRLIFVCKAASVDDAAASSTEAGAAMAQIAGT